MKISKLLLILPLLAVLSGCGKSAKDLKLSETNDPENKKIVLEGLTPEERNLLQAYLVSHAMHGGVDYTVKVGDAIEEQKKVNKAKNSIH